MQVRLAYNIHLIPEASQARAMFERSFRAELAAKINGLICHGFKVGGAAVGVAKREGEEHWDFEQRQAQSQDARVWQHGSSGVREVEDVLGGTAVEDVFNVVTGEGGTADTLAVMRGVGFLLTPDAIVLSEISTGVHVTFWFDEERLQEQYAERHQTKFGQRYKSSRRAPRAAHTSPQRSRGSRLGISRSALAAFYSMYNPSKVAEVDRILASFSPEELQRALIQEYGASPAGEYDGNDDPDVSHTRSDERGACAMGGAAVDPLQIYAEEHGRDEEANPVLPPGALFLVEALVQLVSECYNCKPNPLSLPLSEANKLAFATPEGTIAEATSKGAGKPHSPSSTALNAGLLEKLDTRWTPVVLLKQAVRVRFGHFQADGVLGWRSKHEQRWHWEERQRQQQQQWEQQGYPLDTTGGAGASLSRRHSRPAGYAVLIDTSGIWRMCLRSGAAVRLHNGDGYGDGSNWGDVTGGVTYNGTLYLVGAFDGVRCVDISSGRHSRLCTSPIEGWFGIQAIAAIGSAAYVLDDGSLWKIDLTDGSHTRIPVSSSPSERQSHHNTTLSPRRHDQSRNQSHSGSLGRLPETRSGRLSMTAWRGCLYLVGDGFPGVVRIDPRLGLKTTFARLPSVNGKMRADGTVETRVETGFTGNSNRRSADMGEDTTQREAELSRALVAGVGSGIGGGFRNSRCWLEPRVVDRHHEGHAPAIVVMDDDNDGVDVTGGTGRDGAFGLGADADAEAGDGDGSRKSAGQGGHAYTIRSDGTWRISLRDGTAIRLRHTSATSSTGSTGSTGGQEHVQECHLENQVTGMVAVHGALYVVGSFEGTRRIDPYTGEWSRLNAGQSDGATDASGVTPAVGTAGFTDDWSELSRPLPGVNMSMSTRSFIGEAPLVNALGIDDDTGKSVPTSTPDTALFWPKLLTIVPLLDFDPAVERLSSPSGKDSGEVAHVVVGNGVGVGGSIRNVQIMSTVVYPAESTGGVDDGAYNSTIGGDAAPAAKHADSSVYANVVHRRSEGGSGGADGADQLGHYQSELVRTNQKIRLGRVLAEDEALELEGVGVGGTWGTTATMDQLDEQRARVRELNEKAVMMKARSTLEVDLSDDGQSVDTRTVEAMFKKVEEAEELLADMLRGDETRNSSAAYAEAVCRGGYSGTVSTSANYHQKANGSGPLKEDEDVLEGVEQEAAADAGVNADVSDSALNEPLSRELLCMIEELCWPPRIFNIDPGDREDSIRNHRNRRHRRDRRSTGEDSLEDEDEEEQQVEYSDDSEEEEEDENFFEKVLGNSRLVTSGGRQMGAVVILDILLSSHGTGVGKNPAPLLVRDTTTKSAAHGAAVSTAGVPGGRGSPGSGGRPSALLRALCQCGFEWRPGDENEEELNDLARLEALKAEADRLEQENQQLSEENDDLDRQFTAMSETQRGRATSARLGSAMKCMLWTMRASNKLLEMRYWLVWRLQVLVARQASSDDGHDGGGIVSVRLHPCPLPRRPRLKAILQRQDDSGVSMIPGLPSWNVGSMGSMGSMNMSNMSNMSGMGRVRMSGMGMGSMGGVGVGGVGMGGVGSMGRLGVEGLGCMGYKRCRDPDVLFYDDLLRMACEGKDVCALEDLVLKPLEEAKLLSARRKYGVTDKEHQELLERVILSKGDEQATRAFRLPDGSVLGGLIGAALGPARGGGGAVSFAERGRDFGVYTRTAGATAAYTAASPNSSAAPPRGASHLDGGINQDTDIHVGVSDFPAAHLVIPAGLHPAHASPTGPLGTGEWGERYLHAAADDDTEGAPENGGYTSAGGASGGGGGGAAGGAAGGSGAGGRVSANGAHMCMYEGDIYFTQHQADLREALALQSAGVPLPSDYLGRVDEDSVGVYWVQHVPSSLPPVLRTQEDFRKLAEQLSPQLEAAGFPCDALLASAFPKQPLYEAMRTPATEHENIFSSILSSVARAITGESKGGEAMLFDDQASIGRRSSALGNFLRLLWILGGGESNERLRDFVGLSNGPSAARRYYEAGVWRTAAGCWTKYHADMAAEDTDDEHGGDVL
jgi:hypothetical protein